MILSCHTGTASAFAIELVRQIFHRVVRLHALPEKINNLGGEPSIALNSTWRVKIRHSLSTRSQENDQLHGKKRLRNEGGCSAINQTLGASVPFLREDCATKMARACTVLWHISILGCILYGLLVLTGQIHLLTVHQTPALRFLLQ